MRPLLLVISILVALAGRPIPHLLAQPTPYKPQYEVSIITDGKLVDLSKGISATAKTITIQGKLTPKSLRENPKLKPDVSINSAIISLVRDTRRVGFVNWPESKSLAGLTKHARAGDRFVVQFIDVTAGAKDGTTMTFTNNLLIQMTVF